MRRWHPSRAGRTLMDYLFLDHLVYADAAHVADLVKWGRTTEADEYATRPDVQARIRTWKAQKR